MLPELARIARMNVMEREPERWCIGMHEQLPADLDRLARSDRTTIDDRAPTVELLLCDHGDSSDNGEFEQSLRLRWGHRWQDPRLRSTESRADYVRDHVARVRLHLAEAEGRMSAYGEDIRSVRETALGALARYRARDASSRATRARD